MSSYSQGRSLGSGTVQRGVECVSGLDPHREALMRDGTRMIPNSARRSKDGMPRDLRSEDKQMWMGRVEEMYGYQCEWRVGEYAVEHGDQGDDSYDDEHEHPSDPA